MLARLCLTGAQTADRAWRYVYIFGLTIVRAVGMTRRPVGATSVSKVQNYAFFLLKPNYHRFFSRHWEGTEKLKPTIKLKVDDGEIAVLPFIICLF